MTPLMTPWKIEPKSFCGAGNDMLPYLGHSQIKVHRELRTATALIQGSIISQAHKLTEATPHRYGFCRTKPKPPLGALSTMEPMMNDGMHCPRSGEPPFNYLYPILHTMRGKRTLTLLPALPTGLQYSGFLVPSTKHEKTAERNSATRLRRNVLRPPIRTEMGADLLPLFAGWADSIHGEEQCGEKLDLCLVLGSMGASPESASSKWKTARGWEGGCTGLHDRGVEWNEYLVCPVLFAARLCRGL